MGGEVRRNDGKGSKKKLVDERFVFMRSGWSKWFMKN